MSQTSNLFSELAALASSSGERRLKAQAIANVVREARHYRWVGLYDVDIAARLVRLIAWSGPNSPAYAEFSTSHGLTSRAIRMRHTINVGNVGEDIDYLTALPSTQSEIIIPVLDRLGGVVGTIDVESEEHDAFTTAEQQLLERCAIVLAPLWDLPVSPGPQES